MRPLLNSSILSLAKNDAKRLWHPSDFQQLAQKNCNSVALRDIPSHYDTFKHYNIKRDLPNDITFITSEELLRLYPTLDPSSRVNEYIKKVKALFVIGIGHKLSDGISQDGRAFDYDDWNLNGDLFVYNDLLDNALELSSMGIRVDKEAIINQAILSSNEDKLNLEYQQKIINEEAPFTLGGGIGQSRLCMFFLNKLHVGEVQSSYWDDSTREFFLSKGITLL